MDRLTAALDLSISGGSSTAPVNDEMKEMAQPLGLKEDSAATSENKGKITDQVSVGKDEMDVEDDGTAKKEEEGVGHVMVDGADERALEIDAEAEAAVTSEDIDLEPAALDNEVAKVIAKEEAKAALPPTPPRIRSLSPLPPSRPRTPPRNDEDEAGSSKKRSLSPVSPPAHKRQRRTDYLPLPDSLSHLIHPPTCTLYITNLRRPLVHSALHEHLFPSSTPPGSSSRLPPPRQPFAGDTFPALWLSGVKDHAYATYLSEQDALEAAERVEGVRWPEDTGAELHVEFVNDGLVRGLVEREEEAWMKGRQKLGLKITKDDEEETGYKFELTGGDPNSRGRLPPPRPVQGAPTPAPRPIERKAPVAVPLTGKAPSTNTALPPNTSSPANAPTGPSQPSAVRAPAIFSIRGRALPPHILHPSGRNGTGMGRDERDIRGAVVPPGSRMIPGIKGKEDGRLARPVKRTRVGPSLVWREGPGALAGV